MGIEERDFAYEVVVVGSGVCGALIACKLAESGVRVAILEAGPDVDRNSRTDMVGQFARAENRTPHAPYTNEMADKQAPVPLVTDNSTNGHYLQATPDTPFKSTYQRLVGGSTWHWLGNVPRFLPADFELHKRYGIADDWPIGYEDLERWYCEAERELGVSGDDYQWADFAGAFRTKPFPMPPIWPAYGDLVVQKQLEGAEFGGARVSIRTTPQARNSVPYQGRPPCAGNSSCVPICPIAAKYDASIHVRKACTIGAVLLARCVVTNLEVDETGRIRRVFYRRWANDGSSETGSVEGRIVVLAAHAIETPLIMLSSGLAPASPVGRYLMDHLQGYGMAVLPDPVFPFRGPPVTSGIDTYRDGPWRGQRAAFRMSLGNDGWGRAETPETTIGNLVKQGLWGSELRTAAMNRLTRMFRMSYSTEMMPERSNRVSLSGLDAYSNPRPELSFSLPGYNSSAFKYANDVMAEMFHALGANDVRFSYPDKNYSGAGHIMGTCRMGSDASRAVTDADCRVYGHSNLYVAGASLFTTSGTANPTLTAAALALRLADHITSEGSA